MESKEKLEYIANNYTKAMHHEAYEILKDYHYAEDACQDAFLNLCRVVDRIDDVTSPSARAYCIKTVKNCAINIIRKNNHSVPVDEIFGEDEDVRAVYDHYPSDTVDMVNDIEQLPEKYKNIIRMRCLEDKTAEQTARELGTNVNTVNTQLLRARKILREKWEAIAAVAVCIILALLGGSFILGGKESSVVNYEPQVSEAAAEIYAEDEGTADDILQEAAGEASENAEVPAEILAAALAEAEGATEQDVVSQTVLTEDSDTGTVYEIIIMYRNEIHIIKLDSDGKIISHETKQE